MFQVCETHRHQVILVSSHQKRLEDINAWRLYCPDAVSSCFEVFQVGLSIS